MIPIDTQGVWIIVPAFNEAQVIGEVVTDLRARFAHVVCVDDGSRDDTGAVALRAGAHLVRHPINLGQGAAIQTGVEYARRQPGATAFATFDADGQHRISDVLAMVERLGRGDVDIVIGTRFGGPASDVAGRAAPASDVAGRTPPLKRLILQAAAWLSPSSRRLGLTDAHNGLRVFSRTVADNLALTMSGMSHASEFVSLIDENRWRVVELPVEILYTDYSISKGQPLLNGVNIVFDGFLRGRMRR